MSEILTDYQASYLGNRCRNQLFFRLLVSSKSKSKGSAGVEAGLSIRAGSRPKQPATDQPLAGYFRLILLLILVRNLK